MSTWVYDSRGVEAKTKKEKGGVKGKKVKPERARLNRADDLKEDVLTAAELDVAAELAEDMLLDETPLETLRGVFADSTDDVLEAVIAEARGDLANAVDLVLSMNKEQEEDFSDVESTWEEVDDDTSWEVMSDAWEIVGCATYRDAAAAPPTAVPAPPTKATTPAVVIQVKKKMPMLTEERSLEDDRPPVGEGELLHARRSRRSKQSAASRIKRLENKQLQRPLLC